MGINKDSGTGKSQNHDREQQALENLRARLGEPGPWQEGMKRLAHDLTHQGSGEGDTQEAMNIIAIVVSDAMAGADIATRYPDFYQRMLNNSELQDAFIDALDTLEAEAAGELAPLPQQWLLPLQTAQDLSFLQPAEGAPVLERLSPTGWRLSWELAVAQIQALFSPLNLNLAYRGSADLLEDEWFTLLRSATAVGEVQLDVLLEASQPIDQPGSLQLMATLNPPAPGQPPLPALQAHVQWGDYQATATFNRSLQSHFPALPLGSIWDQERQTVTDSLSLILETLP